MDLSIQAFIFAGFGDDSLGDAIFFGSVMAIWYDKHHIGKPRHWETLPHPISLMYGWDIGQEQY